MKSIIYLFSAILPLLFMSCSDNEYDSDSALYFKTSLLEAPAEKTLKSSGSGEDELFTGTLEEPPKETVIAFCTGKDLKWYNGTTRELKFKDHIENSIILNFFVYLDEKFLFGMRLVPNVMSYVVNEPVLLNGLMEGEPKHFIGIGYPDWDLECMDKNDPWRIEREKNWKALVESEGWQLFIEQLKKEGRYRE